MCGVIGILAQGPVNQALYDGLTLVQHRGQDAAGIITSDNIKVYLRKDNGLIRDVFHTRHMRHLTGNMGIGHCRYPTAGSSSPAEAQPFYVNSPFGLALGHNGNLTNAADLRESLYREDLRHLNTNSDSEILLNVLAHELHAVLGGRRDQQPNSGDVFQAVEGVYRRVRGAFAIVAMIVGGGLLAFRDAYGIRPLVYGTKRNANGLSHMFVSESVALDVLGFELDCDLRPGEAIYVNYRGEVDRRVCVSNGQQAPCIFEHVYLARPDSIIDGIAVHKTRLRMGEKLAHKLQREWQDKDIDVVIPIPDTSRTAALQMSYELGLKYREGFIKNRYIGRTFIMPGQEQRQNSVRQKLNPIELEFKGKNVLLVDDSIVRGNTSTKIIQMARDVGAKKVYFASAAPPVRFPNVYGIDMPDGDELVACGRSEEEICREIGADRLIFQDLEDLIDAAHEGNPSIKQFETSCFDGSYITGDVSEDYLYNLRKVRSDDAKSRSSKTLELNDVNSYSYS